MHVCALYASRSGPGTPPHGTASDGGARPELATRDRDADARLELATRMRRPALGLSSGQYQ